MSDEKNQIVNYITCAECEDQIPLPVVEVIGMVAVCDRCDSIYDAIYDEEICDVAWRQR